MASAGAMSTMALRKSNSNVTGMDKLPEEINEMKIRDDKLFRKSMPPEAVDLVSRFLQYSPNLRCTALDACIHPFFDELRDPNTRLPNGRPLPPLFNFKPQEVKGVTLELLEKLIPEYARKQCQFLAL